MKIRNGNEYTKYTYTTSQEIIDLRAEKRATHRLHNSIKPRRLPSQRPIERESLTRLGITELFNRLEEVCIIPKYAKLYKHKYVKIVPQPKRKSIVEQNCIIVSMLGYVPKKTKPNTYTCIHYRKERKIQINIKKIKEVSPYWQQKIKDWENKQAS